MRGLFVGELGWDCLGGDMQIPVGGRVYLLEGMAEKRGFVVFRCKAEGGFPDHPLRQKIEREVAKRVREHLIVYVAHEEKTQIWQWVKREWGRPERTRTHVYHRGRTSALLVQKLEGLAFALEEEEKGLSIVDVAGRVGLAFDVEKVTKRFYERFKKEHDAFLTFLKGIPDVEMQRWYVSVMLNRLMFIYFIQKKNFLNSDTNYLRTNLSRSKAAGPDRYYKTFLCPLFFEGFAKPPGARSERAKQQLGAVPYLNGGILGRGNMGRTFRFRTRRLSGCLVSLSGINGIWRIGRCGRTTRLTRMC